MTDPAAAAVKKPAEWHTQLVASMTAVMPNGGKITMQGPPAQSYEDARDNLDQTHELYLEWGGWGGGR